jgi:glycosyltransferase involved in cell wall biosynthesis
MKIVVQIPALNEAASIAGVIKAIPRKIYTENEVLVLVVDDGSTDKTSEVAREVGADFVVRHPVNRGIAKAFKTGVKYGYKIGADIIVNIDADGQFDPEEIPRLIHPIVTNKADVVLGSRFSLDENARKVPMAKRIGNQLVTTTISIISGQRFTDTQCGFRAFSRRAAEELDVLGLFTYTQEMIIDLVSKGFRIREIPIKIRYFEQRKSRVVSSLPKYASKAIGLILLTLLRIHSKSVSLILLCQMSLIIVIYALLFTI